MSSVLAGFSLLWIVCSTISLFVYWIFCVIFGSFKIFGVCSLKTPNILISVCLLTLLWYLLRHRTSKNFYVVNMSFTESAFLIWFNSPPPLPLLSSFIQILRLDFLCVIFVL